MPGGFGHQGSIGTKESQTRVRQQRLDLVVLQIGGCARLDDERPQIFLAAEPVGQWNFEGALHIEIGVVRQMHFGEAPVG